MSLRCASLLVVAVVLGCAQPGGTSASAIPRLHPEADHITAREILAARVDALNAYDVVARLRPQWLHSHGSSSVLRKGTEHARVFVDGQQYGDINSLRAIAGGDVGQIRYYNSSEAVSRFGLRAGTTGVIEVRTRIGPHPEGENGDQRARPYSIFGVSSNITPSSASTVNAKKATISVTWMSGRSTAPREYFERQLVAAAKD